ncbi:MAG: glycosyltransferase [Pyrinomonadaceae bacterium]
MPTANRRAFVALAVEYFLRQDYAHCELLIVDDGDEAVSDLLPRDERIRYVRLRERLTVGAKRNLACEQARGEIIAHWDDDDWHAPHRLSYQVEALLRTNAQVCGINRLLFYDVRDGRGWQYAYPASQRLWLSGSTLCYRREFWAAHRFAGVNVGEDARFVWAGQAEQMTVLPDSTFHVGIIHAHNVSPKQTGHAYWSSYPVEQLRELFGRDWPLYAPEHEGKVSAAGNEQGTTTILPNAQADVRKVSARSIPNTLSVSPARPVRNVFACLVHESQECVVDLVRNLRYHDPDSVILLYNGGQNQALLNHGFPFARYGATLHPAPRPMRWGWLHDFALDCMRHALDNFTFDTLTIVDSDQMAMRPGYSQHIVAALRPNVGLLGNSPSVQGAHTRVPPAVQAWREVELWRPFLRRFARGEEKFVHWTFWPSTVFTHDAARSLVKLFATDEQLKEILTQSRIWATEEIILPTLVALLGYEVAANPCSYELVKYRQPYTVAQLNAARARADVFWVHPVPRRYDDALRRHIRTQSNHYERLASPGAEQAAPASSVNSSALLLTWPIIQQMRQIEGWLEDEEADLLIATTARALTTLPAPHTIVEVGSYCGRATVVMGRVAQQLAAATRIHAIDPHDGRVGALDAGLQQRGPTLERFRRNIAAAGLKELVEVVQSTTAEIEWSQALALLLVDGLHDYANVARDFFRFDEHVVAGGFVAFHDYAPYYPGVQTFVNELLSTRQYRKVRQAGSLIVLRKSTTADV